jgi:hypothetical protein
VLPEEEEKEEEEEEEEEEKKKKKKGKGQSHPVMYHEGTEGRSRYSSTHTQPLH